MHRFDAYSSRTRSRATYPNGIGNSSDVIGRYLTEQVRFHMYGFAPELIGHAKL